VTLKRKPEEEAAPEQHTPAKIQKVHNNHNDNDANGAGEVRFHDCFEAVVVSLFRFFYVLCFVFILDCVGFDGLEHEHCCI
jgi:hypothetical protein